MEVAILKNDGTAVALDSSFTEKAFDIEGFLLEFNFKNSLDRHFKYYQKNDFKLADREKYTSVSGYYVEEEYLSYMQGLESDSPGIEDLKSKFLFKFDKYKAKAGDPIKVSVVDLGEPYSRYYNNVDYTFNVENLESSNTPRKYLKSIYEGVVKIGYEIDIPSNAVKNVIERTPLKLATRYFYNNNYTRYFGVWTSDVTKHNIKKIATLISFRIAEIEREIFPKLANSSTWGMLDAIADSPNGSIDSLNDFQKMLFILKKTWGYYHDPSADEYYVHKRDFEPIFSFVPGYEDYLNYYNNLTGFYYSLYKIQDKLLNISEDLRLRYLLQTLPVSALTIVPYSIIKNQLSGYSQIKELPENSQRFIVHLVISITKRLEYADDFLDFLLKKEDGVVTIFEVLYHLLNDARLERLSIVNWFVDEQTNRKYYAYAIFELWKVSKYNWEYFPSTNTSNPDSVNLSSYFFSSFNAKELNKDNILEFDAIYKSVLNTSTSSISNKTVKYNTSIDGKTISISSLILSIVKEKFGLRDGGYSTPKFGDFHLYHPISLIGYQPNLDLAIPQKMLIPAFLFHFAEEYDRLADFDSQLSLGIDVAVDIALFFATGGAAVLRDLKYLKYVTKLGQALRGELAATEAVVVWRASEISAEIITFTASTIANYNQYLTTAENDPEKRKHHQKIQWIILGLLFVSAAGTAYSRIKAVKEANEVLELMSKFPGTAHGVPPSLVELLQTLAGKRAVLTSKMGSKLQTLKNEGVAVDNIIAKYSALTDKQKYKFLEHFGEINDKSIWRELNFFQGQPIDNWLILSEKNIMEAKIIAFITKPKRVNAIVKYYDEPSLRKVLEGFDYQSRLKILDEFGKPNWMNDAVLFERIIEKPSSLNLIRIFQNSTKTGLDVFSFDDVIAIVKTEFKNVTIDYLSVKSTMVLKEVVERYGSEIVNETIELGRLRSLYNGTATDFENIVSAVDTDFLDVFYSSNKLVAKTQVYNNNDLVKFVTEKFISGKESQVLEMFGGTLPAALKEPLYSKFEAFNKKAIDFIPKNRRNDTEIKYIFNFLENHWDEGDRYVIQLESTFYTCQSCQGYLVYLKELAKKAGKTIDIKVVADKNVSGTFDLIDLLNKKKWK